VARDRQRAKQRRRRQPGAGGNTPGPSRTRPQRERELEAEAEADAGSTVFPQRGDVQPVGPDVPVESDEELIEFEETHEPAPDELDPAVTEERAEHRAPRRQRGRIFTFLGHVVDELRRVQWPDRRHVGQGTAVVLGFVVIAGSYLGLMDAIWKPLIEAIL
jgi:preprotein translocase SecE subunit